MYWPCAGHIVNISKYELSLLLLSASHILCKKFKKFSISLWKYFL